MTQPTLSHICHLMNNPWKLGSVFAVQKPSTGPSTPGAAAVAGFLSLSYLESDRWIWNLGPACLRTDDQQTKKPSPVFEQRVNNCSWPRGLWLWRSQGWTPSNNDTINWCCRTQAPPLHLRLEKYKQNRAAASLLPFRSTHNWFQATLQKVVESKGLRDSPRDTYSIC